MNKTLKAVFAAVSSLLVLGATGAYNDAEAARKKTSYSKKSYNKTYNKKSTGKKTYSKKRSRKSFKKATGQAAVSAKVDEQTKDYFEKYGLPPSQDARSLQRLLHMAGYDIGSIDGKVKEATLEQGIRKMLVKYPERFKDMFEGDPAALTEKQLVELIPALYQRVAKVGILNLRSEPDRWVMFIRATDSSTVYGDRTMVHGEMIMRAPDGREAFMVDRGAQVDKEYRYKIEIMTRKEWEARKEKGENIFRPQFNTGGLNYGKIKRAGQPARLPWNPYAGSALPGLSGGTVYGMTIRDGLINAKKAPLPRSFADLEGYKSWITIDIVDPQVANGRNGFGFHVDGITASRYPNDGTAGCVGVREEYARQFFEFIKQMSPETEPSHFIVIPPVDPMLKMSKEMEEFYESLFGVPDRAIRAFEKLINNIR